MVSKKNVMRYGELYNSQYQILDNTTLIGNFTGVIKLSLGIFQSQIAV